MGGRWMRALANVISLLLMAMLFVGAVQMVAIGWLGGLTLLLAISLISVLVHEIGHAAMLRRLGGRVDEICVFGLSYDFQARRWRAGTLYEAQDIGGYVIGAFDPDTATSRKDMLVAMAGPAANMVLALILIALLGIAVLLADPAITPPAILSGAPDMAVPARLPGQAAIEAILADADARMQAAYWASLAAASAKLLALASIGMAIVNLIPFRGSDGDIIRQCRAAL